MQAGGRRLATRGFQGAGEIIKSKTFIVIVVIRMFGSGAVFRSRRADPRLGNGILGRPLNWRLLFNKT